MPVGLLGPSGVEKVNISCSHKRGQLVWDSVLILQS